MRKSYTNITTRGSSDKSGNFRAHRCIANIWWNNTVKIRHTNYRKGKAYLLSDSSDLYFLFSIMMERSKNDASEVDMLFLSSSSEWYISLFLFWRIRIYLYNSYQILNYRFSTQIIFSPKQIAKKACFL